MSESMRLLLFPLIAVIAWFVSRRNGQAARKAVRVLSILVSTIFIGIVISGWTLSQPAESGGHKWSGHALVIAVWLIVPFSVGVALQQNMRRRPGVAIAQAIVLLSLLALVLLASFTGYLAPSGMADIAEETMNRFTVLHMFLLPSLISILLCVWYWLFRPDSAVVAEQSNAVEPKKAGRLAP